MAAPFSAFVKSLMNSWSSQWLYMPVALRTACRFFSARFCLYFAHLAATVSAVGWAGMNVPSARVEPTSVSE